MPHARCAAVHDFGKGLSGRDGCNRKAKSLRSIHPDYTSLPAIGGPLALVRDGGDNFDFLLGSRGCELPIGESH